MDAITKIRNKARQNKKTIVLPESEDKRVYEASRILEKEGIANALLLTPDLIDNAVRERYIEEFYNDFGTKGIDLDSVKKLFDDPLYYAAKMVGEGKVDGFVAGASHTTADTVRSALRCVGVDESLSVASSCFIMVIPNCPYGEEGTFVYADCGVIPDPNSRQLACIAKASADLALKVLEVKPRIAFLSYSTKGSAKTRSAEKIREALVLLKEMAPDLIADGELQVDAAIVPEVADIKHPESILGGKANVLIYPNLEAGNISYKLTQRLANARALGPLLMGFKKPCSDLSRGCSVDDVVDCAAVTAIRAQ